MLFLKLKVMEETMKLREGQVVIGEKLKSILMNDFGKKSISSKYNINTTSNIDMVVTFMNNDSYQRSKFFLSSELGINISKIEELKDKYVCIISLKQVVNISGKKVKIYYQQRFGSKLSAGHIQEILDKLERAQPAVEHNEEFEDSEEVEQTLKPELVPVVKEPPPEVQKIKEKTIFVKDNKKTKFVFGMFIHRVVKFEENLDSPILEKVTQIFNFGINGNIQTIHCKDKLVFYYLGKAISWYITNNYSVLPAVFFQENKIIVDFSSSEKNGRGDRVTSGSFCLPPNEGTTMKDMERRLHRISYLTKPVIKKLHDYFKVEYPSLRVAKNIHSIVSKMGWKSKIDDNNLYIFIDSLLYNIKEGEIKNSPAPVEEVILPFETKQDKFDFKIYPINGNTLIEDEFLKFSGSREDEIDELRKLYEDPELSALLTTETKNDIFEVLQTDWRRRHPEEYARALLSLIKK